MYSSPKSLLDPFLLQDRLLPPAGLQQVRVHRRIHISLCLPAVTVAVGTIFVAGEIINGEATWCCKCHHKLNAERIVTHENASTRGEVSLWVPLLTSRNSGL